MKELVFLILISTIISYLVFPLNKESKEITSSDDQFSIIQKLDYCKYYIIINIGSEKVNVKAYITQSNSEFSIGGHNIKNSKYNELLSETYNCTNQEKINIDYGTYREGVLSTESFNIINSTNKEQVINNLEFILGVTAKYNDAYEGEIGIHLPFNKPVADYNLIFCLKRANATDSYNWFFDFDNFDKGEGKMIVDGFPHDLNSIYKEENFAKISALNKGYTFNWGILFSSVYYDNTYKTVLNFFDTHIDFDKGLISAPYDLNNVFESLFFEKYIEDKICFKETFDVYKDIFFYCKESPKLNIEEFKSIYFESKELEIIFELDYNDLFYFANNYIIFLVTFKKDSNIWSLGEIFYKKYYMVFNQEAKTVGYYQGMESKNRDKNKKQKGKNFKINLIHILLILIFISICVVGFIIYTKKSNSRKLRANEMDDNYVYEQEKDKVNVDEKKNNLLIN